MIDVMEAKDLFLSHYSALEKNDPPEAFAALRGQGNELFAEMGLPGPRDEDWRFTPLTALASMPLDHVLGGADIDLSAEELEALAPPPGPCHRLVLVNGSFVSRLSTSNALPEGVLLSGLLAAWQGHRHLVDRYLGRLARLEGAPFTALNTAFLTDGLFLYLPRGVVLPEPVHLVYVADSDASAQAIYPRTLIVCQENSQATVVQSFVSRGKNPSFTNAVTEIKLGASALVRHCKVLREDRNRLHFDLFKLKQDRASVFRSQSVTLGGRLVRNEIEVGLDAENCETTLNGIYTAGTGQHVDNRTTIDHAMPRCASHELYKGILDGKGVGVFNGKIMVRQDAQKTDAKQTNKTLLLSDEAVIHTKPQLEIFADDVKCTHGATVGQVAQESLFYLRARGIGLAEARAMLTFAFANEVIQDIPAEPLRRDLEIAFLGSDQTIEDL